MNNLEELKQELKNLENKINELENKGIEEINKYKRKRFDYDEYYWYVNIYGAVSETVDGYVEEDYFNYNIGNYFETKEQAENYKEKLLIEQELKDIAMELNKGEEIDWNNKEQEKYYLLYNFDTNNIMFDYYISHKIQGAIYCLDTNFMFAAAERIGEERLTRYLKGELD